MLHLKMRLQCMASQMLNKGEKLSLKKTLLIEFSPLLSIRLAITVCNATMAYMERCMTQCTIHRHLLGLSIKVLPCGLVQGSTTQHSQSRLGSSHITCSQSLKHSLHSSNSTFLCYLHKARHTPYLCHKHSALMRWGQCHKRDVIFALHTKIKVNFVYKCFSILPQSNQDPSPSVRSLHLSNSKLIHISRSSLNLFHGHIRFDFR